MRLENKACVITGAGSGIGRASAVKFAKEGANLILVDIDREGLEETLKGINTITSCQEVYLVTADVSHEEEVQGYLNTSLEKFGKIDVLLNNAGVVGPNSKLEDIHMDDVEKVLNVNLKGVFLGLKHALKMMKRQRSGAIVNTASRAGILGVANVSVYVATKHSVVGLTKNAAIEYAQYGIRINALCPGFTNTEMAKATAEKLYPGHPQKYYDEKSAHIPARRCAEPEEMANVAAFLASDEASYIHGQAIIVDGGQSIL